MSEGEEGAAAVRLPLRRALRLNLAGVALTALIAVVAVPRVAAALGPERFGLLALVWTTVTYLGLFHFGVGRALTQLSAGPADAVRDRELAALLWTGLALTGLVGVAAGIALYLGAPLLAVRLLRVSPQHVPEAVAAFRTLSLALPATISAQVLAGALEARMRFGWTNTVSVLGAVLGYLGPVAVAAAGGGLVRVVAVVAASRVLVWCAYLGLCLYLVPAARRVGPPAAAQMGRLLRFGGWATVSNLISPVMSYLDRFMVAGLVSATAVAYYATPQEVMLRAGLLTGAISAVLFPAFAAASRGGAGAVADLLRRGVRVVSAVILPVSVALAAFAHDGLSYWLGGEYALNGAPVVRWLAVGLVVNGAAKVAAAMIQGLGHPKVAAQLHLAEVLPYLGLLWLLVSRYGVEGAAMAWTARAACDAICMFTLAARLEPSAAGACRDAAVLGAAGVAAVGLAALSPSPLAGVAMVGAAAAVSLFQLRPGAGGLPALLQAGPRG